MSIEKDEEYRIKHNISPTQMYYHKDENMWRPDYIEVHLPGEELRIPSLTNEEKKNYLKIKEERNASKQSQQEYIGKKRYGK